MKILKFFAFVAIVAIMAACSGNSAADIAAKISKGEQLSEKDYSAMIDYCATYAKDAQTIQDKLDNLIPTSEEAGRLTEQMADLTKKFPYVNVFFDKLSSATTEDVGQANIEKISSLSNMIWFTAPEWANVAPADTDSEIVGDIVEMPANDSSNVIAVGDGEAVAETPKN